MTDTKLHTGKKPATYSKKDLRYSDLRPTGIDLSQLPKTRPWGGGYGMDFGATGWGMLGNGPCDDGSIQDTSAYIYNGAGDCAWAGPAHETMELDKNAGRPVPKFTCLNILYQYAEYLGLGEPTQIDANTDQGSDVREVLNWRQTKGLIDFNGGVHKVGVYVALEPGNLQDLWEALYFFETVGIGIEFPGSAMDQFNNNNQIWSVVNGAQIDGGHYIPLVGRPQQNVWTCVTWGDRQTMTSQFITKYCDEAWAYITPERYNQVTGQTLEHWKDADLEKFITEVGNQA